MSTEPDLTQDSQDSPPYIRTFAKDFAALSGKAPAEPQQKIVGVPKIPKQKKGRGSLPNLIPERDESPVTDNSLDVDSLDLRKLQREAEGIDAKTIEQYTPITPRAEQPESLSLPRINPGDIIQQFPHEVKDAPVPVQHPVPVAAPISIPVVPPTPVPSPELPKEAAVIEREAVLARLKARLESHQKEAAPPPPIEVPKPVAPPNIPIPPPLPEIPLPEPTPTPPAVPPAPPQVLPAQASPIHTYTTDFSDHVEKEHATAFAVLAADRDTPRRPVPTKQKKTNFLPIIAGILLLVLGTGSLFAAYLYMSKSAPVPSIIATPSLIIPDSKIALSGTGSTLLQAFVHQADQPLPDNNVLLTYINESTTTPDGVIEQAASGGAFITSLNLPAPDILLRNIDPISTVGIVHAGSETRPFFILRVTSYERTFAGMLEWEGNMAQNLSTLYPRYKASEVASSASSTTPVVSSSYGIDPTAPASQFMDEIVASHDTRVLKDGAGRTIILYGYTDKQTLILSRDEASFTLLLSRMSSGPH
jgi:hypothetical protein